MIPFRTDRHTCTGGGPERLQLFLDRELPEAKRAALAAHLERCAVCAAALQRLAAADRRLVSAQPIPPPMSAATSRALLDRALAEAGGRRGSRHSVWLPLVSGFAVGAAILLWGVGVGGWMPAESGHRHAGGQKLAAAVPPGSAAGIWSESGVAVRSPAPKLDARAHRPRRPSHSGGPAGKRHSTAVQAGPPVPPARTAPRPEAPPRRNIPRPHRFVASRPPRPTHETLPPASIEGETPAPGTGAACAELTPATVELASLPAPGSPDLSSQADESRPPVDDFQAVQSDPSDPADQSDPTEPAPGTGGGPASPPDVGLALAPDVPDTGLAGQAMPSSGAGEDSVPPALPAAPRLLVLVSSTPAPSPVTVTVAPADAPSYARATALQPDAGGGAVWAQATASNDGSGEKLAMVLLGSDPWPWQEDQ